MNPLVAILAQAGISLAGKGITGAMQPPMPTMQWGAESARFASFLQEQLRPQAVESISRLRLEAARTGTPMGGAYLEGVSEIEQRLDEIFGREISRFEIEQMQAKRGWGQQMEMLRYQRGQERRGMVESMFGTLAAIPGQMYGAEQQARTTEAMTSVLGGMGETQPATGMLDPLNALIMSQMAQFLGDTDTTRTLLQQMMKVFGGGTAGGEAGHPTPFVPPTTYGTVRR